VFKTELPADLVSCFESTDEAVEHVRGATAALRTSGTRGIRKLSGPQVIQVRFLRNLGLVLGSTNSRGVKALEKHPWVKDVVSMPELSPVSPKRIVPRELRSRSVEEIAWGIKHLNVPYLWGQGLRGKGIKIGHLDTGADGKHPMLEDVFEAFAEFDNMGNRVIPNPRPHDTDKCHGTHTAGIIAGRPISGYKLGVAPEAKLASAIVIDGGIVTLRVLAGLDWALEQGIRVLNMSLGVRGKAQEFLGITERVRERGVLLIAAIGNEGQNSSRSPGNNPDVLSVGAMNAEGDVPDFSSSSAFPPPPNRIVPDVVAPGVAVLSAAPQNKYMLIDGTSMAAPHISGVAALLFQAKPDATPDEVREAIFNSCELLTPMRHERANRGVPNAEKAYRTLTGDPGG